METKKITIHRALAELKTIDSRIEKKINNLKTVGLQQNEKLVDEIYDKNDFCNNAKAGYQSIVALIERKSEIKSAITLSNSITLVIINGGEMTIADAINKRDTIKLIKDFADDLERKRAKTLVVMEKNNFVVDKNALKLAEAALQKDNISISDSDVIAITEPYLNKNKFLLVDPIDVSSKIIEMEDLVSKFELEIDASLSESNAITFITI